MRALKVFALLLVWSASVCLAACGMQGDLYLPDEKSEPVKQDMVAE